MKTVIVEKDDDSEEGPVAPSKYWQLYDLAAGLCTEAELGRLKGPLVEARRLAQRATPIAIKALIEVAREADSSGSRVKAANALLDRGWGRPEQPVQATGGFGPTPAILEEMPWISPRRLSYQEGSVIAQDIFDKSHASQTKFVAATDPLPADIAAEPSPGPAQHANSISAPVERPEPKSPLRPAAAANEKRDVRRDNGPRGNAKHR